VFASYFVFVVNLTPKNVDKKKCNTSKLKCAFFSYFSTNILTSHVIWQKFCCNSFKNKYVMGFGIR